MLSNHFYFVLCSDVMFMSVEYRKEFCVYKCDILHIKEGPVVIIIHSASRPLLKGVHVLCHIACTPWTHSSEADNPSAGKEM